MIKIYCIVCDKYRKLKNPKISYIFIKTLGLSIVCSKCDYEYKNISRRRINTNIKNSWFNY